MIPANGKKLPAKRTRATSSAIKYGKDMVTVSDQIDAKGVEEFNPNVADRQITLLMRKVLEKGLMSKDILLEKKVDWALRGIALFEGTKSTIWNKDERREPKTAMQLEQMKARSDARLRKLQHEVVMQNRDEKVEEIIAEVESREDMN